MTRRVADIVVDARVEDVFAAVTDLNGWPEWLPIDEFPDGAPVCLAEGTQFRLRLSFFGIGDTVHTTVTEHRAPHRFAFLAEGNHGSDLDVRFAVEPLTEGRSRLRGEFDVVGDLPRPMQMLMKRSLDKVLQRTLRQFAEHARRRSEPAH